MRKVKKYKGGGLAPWAIGGQVLGNLANIGIGIGQRKKGEARYEQGREDFIGNLGASDALASFSDEQATLANQARKQGNEKADSALAGLIQAQKSGDPRFMQTLGIDQIASDTQERGLLTAQNIATARSPLVQAEEKAKDQMTALYGQDMTEGTAAFNAGTQNIMGGTSGLLNMPLDMMTAEAAGVDFGFKDGGLIGGGGMSMKGFGGFKKDKDDFPDSPRDVYNEEVEDQTRSKVIFTDEEERKKIEEIKRSFNIQGSYANGGTIQQLIAEGGSFVTPGVEDHETQEFDIVDSETGETVAKTTGQERHENSAEGLSITNSEQDQGMRDVFSSIRDKKNPTEAELRMLYEANFRVYSQPKFA